MNIKLDKKEKTRVTTIRVEASSNLNRVGMYLPYRPGKSLLSLPKL